MSSGSRLLTGVLICAASIAALAAALAPPRVALSAEPDVSFKTQVLPILDQYCVTCHSPSGVGYKAVKLDLQNYAGVRAGSTMGVAVIPYHPELSQLVAVLQPGGHAFKNLTMPPVGSQLSPAQVQTISLWIKQGAQDN